MTTASDRRPGPARPGPGPTPAARNAGPHGGDNVVQAPGAAVPGPESRLNRIARRAHEIYEARGGEHGKAMEDWLQAEREIDAAIDAVPTDH